MIRSFFLFLTLVFVSCSAGDGDGSSAESMDSISEITRELTDSLISENLMRESAVDYVEEENDRQEESAVSSDTSLLLNTFQADSLKFRLRHHYTINFNFVVKCDSLTLIPYEGDLISDTCVVYRGDVIAVASIKTMSADSTDAVWVKVAHDQYTMGWINETDLLNGVAPDDSISEMIYFMTGIRGVWMSSLVLMGVIGFLLRRGKVKKLQILRFDEMDSFYPVLLLTTVGIMGSLYASIQNFVPEFWQEFYYHPTLNPFQLPMIMSALVFLFWLIVIIYIAVVDEVYHNFYFLPGVAYLLELTGLTMVVYLIISWTTLIYVGYVLLLAMIISLWYIYLTKNSVK